MTTSNNDNRLFVNQTDTFIPNDNHIDNIDNDKKERVIWTFTLGMPIDTKCDSDSEKQKENFEKAVFEMSREITKITDGLTYYYCNGMWLRKHNKNSDSDSNSNNNIEHNISVQLSIVVLPEIENEIYNLVKNIISKINKKYELGLIHIQAIKTYGFASHFIV